MAEVKSGSRRRRRRRRKNKQTGIKPFVKGINGRVQSNFRMTAFLKNVLELCLSSLIFVSLQAHPTITRSAHQCIDETTPVRIRNVRLPVIFLFLISNPTREWNDDNNVTMRWTSKQDTQSERENLKCPSELTFKILTQITRKIILLKKNYIHKSSIR